MNLVLDWCVDQVKHDDGQLRQRRTLRPHVAELVGLSRAVRQ